MSSEENSDDRPITVGVIDDDPMICQAMRLILEDYSTGRLNVVFTCTDGGQAVAEAGIFGPEQLRQVISDEITALGVADRAELREFISA